MVCNRYVIVIHDMYLAPSDASRVNLTAKHCDAGHLCVYLLRLIKTLRLFCGGLARPLLKHPDRSTGGMSAPASQRTKVKRAAERASYEIEHIYSILDEGLVAHVGVVQDNTPFVIPMGYARKGNQLLLHGSISSRLMKVRANSTTYFFCRYEALLPFVAQI